jgi:hypothetical protein
MCPWCLSPDTYWDLLNVGTGAISLTGNLITGNWAGALVDAGGIATDFGAAAVPGVPGGAAAAIQTTRAATNVVEAATKAASAAPAPKPSTLAPGDGVRLYRSVGPNELKSIQQTGKFGLGPNGAEVKGFVRSESDARALTKAYDAPGRPQTVVSGLAPRSVIDKAEAESFSDVPGRPMEGLYVRGNDELGKICGIEICK